MRRRGTQLSLVLIFLLTVFSIITVWPSNPKRYLPDFIPWPQEACVGPVCMGKGIRIPMIQFDAGNIVIGHLERREMRLGLDLRGGTRLVLEADISGQPNIDLDEALDSAVEVVERRVNAFGVAESITERVGSNRISVQLPGITAEEAMATIGRTAQLQFMELAVRPDNTVMVEGYPEPLPLATLLQPGARSLLTLAQWRPVTAVDERGVRREITGVFLNRSDIYVQQSPVGLPLLVFGMNSEGAKLLEQATRRLSELQLPMAFFLDGEPILGIDGEIVAPRVQTTISDSGQITGLSQSDAQTLATLLRTGAFPVPLRVVQQEDVDATLGDQAVVRSVQAGLIAIFAVMAFMVMYYRLPGVLASLALVVYVSFTLAVFKIVPVTITSAGMAAFVLSVGMAVDANILIFERMKEELRLGRSLVGAIEAGFSRAWSSIRDSNVATLITCFILFWFGDQFGASLVKGFALTLALGVLVSMFTAIMVSRTFLMSLVGTPVMQHLWLFGTDIQEARGQMDVAPALRGAGGATQAPRSPES
jgi:preprotein translocase subunit SecD